MDQKRSERFQKLLMGKNIIVAPGAFDALSAMLIEQAGFPVVYISGACISVSHLGVPDIGLTTMSEILDRARNVVSVTDVPVICDVDTGYGNAVNLIRTVQEFERIGISAIQVEDQIIPKKCGHIEGKQLISKEEMVKKIEAFQYARKSKHFLLIARTDAIAVTSFEDAIERGKAYAKAGSDILLFEAMRTVEEMREIPKIFKGVPLMVNMVEGGGKTPILPVRELEAMGYRIVIYPGSPLMASIKAMQRVLQVLKETGNTEGFAENMCPFRDFFEMVGLSHYRSLEAKYLVRN